MVKRVRMRYRVNPKSRYLRVKFGKSIDLSTFLFSKPSFWVGAGSILNFSGNYYDFN